MATEHAGKSRIHVYFSGQVQGVGFRATAWNVARAFAVTGYVKNQSDGRVELVAEGTQQELERFLAEVRRRMQRYIEDVHQTLSPARNEFDSFEIR